MRVRRMPIAFIHQDLGLHRLDDGRGEYLSDARLFPAGSA